MHRSQKAMGASPRLSGFHPWHFYHYEPPRELAVIESEIKALEANIVRLLGEITA